MIKSIKEVSMYFKNIVIELFVILSISIIGYMVVESSTNIVVSLLDCTSNRINLDIKIIMFATYIYTFFSFCIKENREKNLWSALTIKLLIQFIMYITILNIYKYQPLYFKFMVLGVTIIIAQLIENMSLKYLNTNNKLDEILKYVNILIVILFIIYFILF